MKRKFSIFFFLLFVYSTAFAQSKSGPPYKIDKIEAFLFYNQNRFFKEADVAGTFSPNVIDNESFSLRNTIIGEGSAEGHSNQTLIVVTISGNSDQDAKRSLHVTAKLFDASLLDKTVDFSISDFKNKHCAAFLLYWTPCAEVKIVATISGKKVESQMHKTIPFECGE